MLHVHISKHVSCALCVCVCDFVCVQTLDRETNGQRAECDHHAPQISHAWLTAIWMERAALCPPTTQRSTQFQAGFVVLALSLRRHRQTMHIHMFLLYYSYPQANWWHTCANIREPREGSQNVINYAFEYIRSAMYIMEIESLDVVPIEF